MLPRCLHLRVLPLPGVCVFQVPRVVCQERGEGAVEEELFPKQNAIHLYWPNHPDQGECYTGTARSYGQDRGRMEEIEIRMKKYN